LLDTPDAGAVVPNGDVLAYHHSPLINGADQASRRVAIKVVFKQVYPIMLLYQDCLLKGVPQQELVRFI
jgi:hypothetical protein